MASSKIAKATFSEVRKQYEAGFKSANKKYDNDAEHVSWWKKISGKAAARNRAQPTAAINLTNTRQDPGYKNQAILTKGQFLLNSGTLAANCGDLAALACYIAHSKHGVSGKQLGVVGVQTKNKTAGNKGADHAFAVYGDPMQLAFLATGAIDLTVGYVDGQSAFSEIYAIDPWANLVCTLDKYPSKAAEKMRSWGAYGKRVLWVYDLNNNQQFTGEWCSPDGEYLTVFSAANLSVSLC